MRSPGVNSDHTCAWSIIEGSRYYRQQTSEVGVIQRHLYQQAIAQLGRAARRQRAPPQGGTGPRLQSASAAPSLHAISIARAMSGAHTTCRRLDIEVSMPQGCSSNSCCRGRETQPGRTGEGGHQWRPPGRSGSKPSSPFGDIGGFGSPLQKKPAAGFMCSRLLNSRSCASLRQLQVPSKQPGRSQQPMRFAKRAECSIQHIQQGTCCAAAGRCGCGWTAGGAAPWRSAAANPPQGWLAACPLCLWLRRQQHLLQARCPPARVVPQHVNDRA